MKLIVAITGASGIIYAREFLKAAKKSQIETHVIISDSAKKVAEFELNGTGELVDLSHQLYDWKDLTAAIASGSTDIDAMVVIPCSMKTVSAITHGYADNLVTRTADVQLKEGRPLIIVPRETPLNAIHLENLSKLARLGVVILPAMPGFYHQPTEIQDLVDFITGKILDQLGVPNKLYSRWRSP